LNYGAMLCKKAVKPTIYKTIANIGFFELIQKNC